MSAVNFTQVRFERLVIVFPTREVKKTSEDSYNGARERF